VVIVLAASEQTQRCVVRHPAMVPPRVPRACRQPVSKKLGKNFGKI